MKIHSYSYAVSLLLCYGLSQASASNEMQEARKLDHSSKDLKDVHRHLRGDKQGTAQEQHARRAQGMMDGGMDTTDGGGGMDMHDGEDNGDHGGDWEDGDQNHMGGGGQGFPFGCGTGGWQTMPMYFANMSNYSGPTDWNWMPMFNETVHNDSAWEGIWHMLLPNTTNVSFPGMWDQLPPFMTPNNSTLPSWDDINEFISNVTSNWTGTDGWDWEDMNQEVNQSGWDWHSVANSTGGWNGGGHMGDSGGMMNHSGWGGGRSEHMGNSSGLCDGMSPDEQWRIMFLLFNVGSMKFDASPLTDGFQMSVTSDDSQVARVLQQVVAEFTDSLKGELDYMPHDAFEHADEFAIVVKSITKGVRVVVTGTTPCAVDMISDQKEALSKLMKGDLTVITEPYTLPASCDKSSTTTNNTSAEANLDQSAAVGQGTFGRALVVGVALLASAML